MLIQYLSVYLLGDASVILYIKQNDRERQLFLECSVSELMQETSESIFGKMQQQVRNCKGLGNQHMNKHAG